MSDDIIKMAREAGLPTAWISESGIVQWAQLERLIALARADEREACAKVCESAIASIWEYSPEDVKQTGTNVCNNLAAAIRARGNT